MWKTEYEYRIALPFVRATRLAMRDARRCVRYGALPRHSPFSPRVLMSPVDRLAFSFMAPERIPV